LSFQNFEDMSLENFILLNSQIFNNKHKVLHGNIRAGPYVVG